MNDRPNIVFLMSDEHDAAVTGCYGDPIVSTPNLDGLAKRGVTFDACYTPSPLCVPARLALTAGQYVSRCNAWGNECSLPHADYPTIPRALRQAGYDALLCGKQHYDPGRRYGYVELLPELSTNQYPKRNTVARRAADDQTVNEKVWKQRSSEFYPAESGGVLDHDREVTAGACQFLANRRRSDGPFMIHVGHLAPHFPLIAPEEIYERYRGRVPMPQWPDGYLDRLPTNYKHLRRGFGLVDTDPEIVQKGRDLYWALVEWYDAEVGKVLDTLAASDVADNTIVIYCSDHGENKGDHGLWWKNNMFDHSARVPLIVSWPARWAGGQRRAEVCSLLDVMQTIVDVAEAEPVAGSNGASMLHWLDNPAWGWEDRAVCEYYGHNIASGFVMYREGQYKYVYHTPATDGGEPETELYDMVEDPQEFNNLADVAEYQPIVNDLHAAMIEELGEHPDVTERRCRQQIPVEA